MQQRFGPTQALTMGNSNNGSATMGYAAATRQHDRTSSGGSRGADGGVAVQEKTTEDQMDVCEAAPNMEEEDLLEF